MGSLGRPFGVLEGCLGSLGRSVHWFFHTPPAPTPPRRPGSLVRFRFGPVDGPVSCRSCPVRLGEGRFGLGESLRYRPGRSSPCDVFLCSSVTKTTLDKWFRKSSRFSFRKITNSSASGTRRTAGVRPACGGSAIQKITSSAFEKGSQSVHAHRLTRFRFTRC